MKNPIANTIFNTFITLIGTGTFGAICFTFYTVIVNGQKIITYNISNNLTTSPKGLVVAKTK